jgi:DNA-binding LacI/PurR family transcriptional regulator
MGIRVPNDLSIVGFDDTPPAEGFDPPITSVRQPIEEMTQAAFLEVLGQIEGRAAGQGRVFPTMLTRRTSTDKPRR